MLKELIKEITNDQLVYKIIYQKESKRKFDYYFTRDSKYLNRIEIIIVRIKKSIEFIVDIIYVIFFIFLFLFLLTSPALLPNIATGGYEVISNNLNIHPIINTSIKILIDVFTFIICIFSYGYFFANNQIEILVDYVFNFYINY